MVSVPASVAPQSLDKRAHAFAGLIVEEEGERCRLNVGIRRSELTAAVVAAVTEFLDVRARRFPQLTANLARRFAIDRLPVSTVRALRAVACEAFAAQWHPVTAPVAPPRKSLTILSRCEIFVPRIGVRRTTAQALTAGFSSVAAWTDAIIDRRDAADAMNAQVDALLVLVRKAGARNEYSARCARAHAGLLETYRAAALRDIAA
jgi:hypothetical protein